MIPYFILIITFVCLSEFRHNGKYPLRFVAVFLLIIFIGLRNEIGADYFTYKKIFENSNLFSFDNSPVEYGYLALNILIKNACGNFKILTLIHAAILVFFLHVTVKDKKYYTFSFLLFILMESGYIFIINGMRQGLAIAIFFYSCRYIQSREFFKYSICLLLASSVHLSVLLMLPLYYLLHRQMKSTTYIVLQFVTWYLFYTGVLYQLMFKILEYTPYAYYLSTQYIVDSAARSGYGYLLGRIAALLVLFNIGRMLKYYPQYIVYINLYFLFIVYRDLFGSIQITARLVHYFSWSIFIVFPIFCSLCFKSNSYKLVQIFILSVYLLFFINRVYTDIDNNLLYLF